MTWLHVPGATSSSAPAQDNSAAASTWLSRAPALALALRRRTMTRAEWREVSSLARSVTWRSTSLPPSSLLRVFATVPSLTLLSGLTSNRSTLERGAASWMESLAATRVSRSAPPASGSASTTPATSGRGSRDTFDPSAPGGASSRTWASIFGSDTTTLSAPTLRALATASRRSSSRRRTSARPTAANDSSSSPSEWQTPVAEDSEQSQRRRPKDRTLTTETREWAMGWPTPKARDYKGGQGEQERNSPDLDKVAEAWPTPDTVDGPPAPPTSAPGEPSSPAAPTSPLRLNPLFVEGLMGWPEGWTSLAPIGSASSATA